MTNDGPTGVMRHHVYLTALIEFSHEPIERDDDGSWSGKGCDPTTNYELLY